MKIFNKVLTTTGKKEIKRLRTKYNLKYSLIARRLKINYHDVQQVLSGTYTKYVSYKPQPRKRKPLKEEIKQTVDNLIDSLEEERKGIEESNEVGKLVIAYDKANKTRFKYLRKLKKINWWQFKKRERAKGVYIYFDKKCNRLFKKYTDLILKLK